MEDIRQDWTYDERPTTSVAVEIDGSSDAVWVLVADIGLSIRFSSEVAAVEWLDGADGPSLGARFKGSNQHEAIGAWEVTCTITGYEPGRVFEWCVGEPDHPSAVWAFELEPVGRAVRLSQRFQMGPAPSGLSPAIAAMPDKESKIIARRLAEHRANMQANVDGVKAIVEGGPPA